MTFRQRLRTVRVDSSLTETRTKTNYYDAEAVAAAFGEDAREELMEDTDGYGAISREDDGSFSRIDHRGVKHEVTPAEVDAFITGPETEDAV